LGQSPFQAGFLSPKLWIRHDDHQSYDAPTIDYLNTMGLIYLFFFLKEWFVLVVSK
jgi:hypothetical protein